MPINTIGEILKLAITREQEAYFFYTDLLEIAAEEPVRQALEWMAGEELRHRRFLVNYRDGKHGAGSLDMKQTVDYRIAEYLDAPESEEIASGHDVYLIAAHREQKSHEFYKEMASLHHEGELRDIMLKMANEELKHKEKMEYLYANTAFPQTAGG